MKTLSADQAALKVLKKSRKWMLEGEIHALVEPMLKSKKCQAGALGVRLRELSRAGLVLRKFAPGKNYKIYKAA